MHQRVSMASVALLVWVSIMSLALPSPGQARRAQAVNAAKNVSTTPRLVVSVQPPRIKFGRDVSLRIRVTDAKGKPVARVAVSITGVSQPVASTAARGAVTLTVRAMSTGTALVQATARGYTAVSRAIPIVPGSPATVVAIKRGMSVLAPRTHPRAGTVGTDLLEHYHALTGQAQYASLGLRDGTLVDLNANTDVLIKDPLHTTLAKGELFLEVVHGAASHQVQVGTAVAATKGTRLDVKVDPRTKAAVVTVIEGQVRVSNKGAAELVGAGQQTTVPLNRPPSPPKPVNLNTILAWIRNLPNTTPTTVPPVLNLPANLVTTAPPPPPVSTPAITVTGTLTSTVWSGGPYLLSGGVTLPANTTLTIAPGTVLEMGPGAYFLVQGTLAARGTGTAPIIVTSAAAQPKPGDWQYLKFDGAGAAGSVLDHVRLFYGSANGGANGMLSLTGGANIHLSNSVLAQATSIGIWVDSFTRPTITGCVFAGLGGYAVDAPVDDLGLITGASYGSNQRGVRVAGTITHAASWERPDVPYELAGGITLARGTTLTVAPGTVLKMGPGAYLLVQGTLTARGTGTAPIIVTSAAAQPKPGDWQYLKFDGAGAAGSVLDHVRLFYGSANGGANGMLSLTGGANIHLSNSVLAQATSIGIWVDSFTRPTITGCVFAGLGGYAVDAPVDDLGLITGASYGSNQRGVRVAGTITHAASWERPDVPYELAGGITLARGTTLTVAPGTVLKMGPGAYLLVQGTLTARGTGTAPIIVTSAAAQPKPGDWQYLKFDGAGAAGSVLDHVRLFYGSANGGANGMLSLTGGANIHLSNSVLAQATSIGIWVDSFTRPTITGCVFAGLGGYAVDAPVDDLGLITGASYGSNQRGVRVAGTITHAASWERPDVPYELTGGITLARGTTLTVAPGSTLEMEPGAYLLALGTLTARGTEATPILVTSAPPPPTAPAATRAAWQPKPGDWQYLKFDGAGAAGSVLDHVQLFYGSANGGANGMLSLTDGADIQVTNSVFAQGTSSGTWVDNRTAPTITGCTFHDDQGPAISILRKNASGVHGNTIAPGQRGIELRS